MNKSEKKFWGLDHIKTPSSVRRSKTPNPVHRTVNRSLTQREKKRSARSRLTNTGSHFVRNSVIISKVEDFILSAHNQNVQFSEKKVYKKSSKVYSPFLRKHTSKESKDSISGVEQKEILVEFSESDNVKYNRAPKITYISKRSKDAGETFESTFFETVHHLSPNN